MALRGLLVGTVFVGIGVAFAACSDDPPGLGGDGGSTTPTSTTTTTSPRPTTSTTSTTPPFPTGTGTTPPPPDAAVPDSSVADSSVADASDGAVAPTFTQVWDTILSQKCGAAGRCHNSPQGSGPAGAALIFNNSKATAYANLVTNGNTATCGAVTKRVTPNNTAQSSLYLKTAGAPVACGGRMPTVGTLLPAEIARIQGWINAGALNN